MTETEKLDEEIDMTPEQFADLSKRAIVELLDKEDAAEQIRMITELEKDPDKNAVQSYIFGLTVDGTVDGVSLITTVNRLLESDNKTE